MRIEREVPRPEFMGGGVVTVYVAGCNCESHRRHVEAERRHSRERQLHLDSLLQQARLDERFRAASLANFECVPGTEFAHERCLGFIGSWDERRAEGRGLLLVGENGCGKTHLVSACVKAAVAQGVPSLFLTTVDFLDALRRGYDRRDANAADPRDLEQEAARVDLLVLDDLGSEKLPADERGDWLRERMYALVDRRYRRMLPMLITTNRSDEELETRLGQRIFRRLVATLEVVPISAGDYGAREGGEHDDAA